MIRDKLMRHRGHNVVCVSYGDWNNPADVCIECEDCNEVLISAEDFEISQPTKRQICVLRDENDPEIIREVISICTDLEPRDISRMLEDTKVKALEELSPYEDAEDYSLLPQAIIDRLPASVDAEVVEMTDYYI